MRIAIGVLVAGVFGAAALTAGAARAEGDADAGKAVFGKCAACHSPNAGENKLGPSLHGVVGRHSHSLDGYNYSDAMKGYDVTWDAATLDHYLENPRGVVQGTRMIFPGLKDEKDRQNVIAYLETLK